jgi:hypothetical protein
MDLLRRRISTAPKLVPEAPSTEANGVEPSHDQVSKMTPEQALKSIDKEVHFSSS